MTTAVLAYGAPILFFAVAMAFTAHVVRANRHPPDDRNPPPRE